MGGFPIVALGNFDEESSYQIVEGIYHSVISKDIAKRHRIAKLDLFHRVARFIIENVGKTFSASQEKFYLADTSLKYCVLGFDSRSIAAMLENVVYFELRRKGYDVYIGKNETKEIDFVAVRRDERIYVQVCCRLPEESNSEIANLLGIKDHYPKYVVTLDQFAAGNVDGVRIVYLADFLLKDDF